MATEPATRPLLLDRELCTARLARTREVINDRIHPIRRLVLTASTPMPRLPASLASLTISARKLLRFRARLRPPLRP
jgi:hypothetical protein